MRKQLMLAAALLAALFLTACGARTEQTPAPAEPSAAEKGEEAPAASEESGAGLLDSVDFSAFQDTMTPEEWEGLSRYLPVLEGDAVFHWINGVELAEDAPYHKTSEGVRELGRDLGGVSQSQMGMERRSSGGIGPEQIGCPGHGWGRRPGAGDAF